MRCVIIGLMTLFIAISCTTDEVNNYPLGSDFIDNNVQIRVIDTFAIHTGTFRLDSLITSGKNRILLGSMSDSNFGNIRSQTYMQLKNSNFEIASNATYDSIGFILNYDTYIYGDSTKTQTYKIHRVLETLKPVEGDDFYNSSKLEYDELAAIGELTFVAQPNSGDGLYIPMDAILGEELFNKIADNEINNSDDFLQYFKGLTIVPEANSNSHLLGFNATTLVNSDTNSSMRLYYTVDDGDDEDNDYYIDFVIASTGKLFNAISADLSNTHISAVVDRETVAATETNDLIFSQAGIGISSRIEIPSLKKLNEISDVGTPLAATLTFKPANENYTNNTVLQDSLLVYIIDNKNRIINQLTDLNGTISYAILNENKEFNSESYYSVELGGFVDEILNSPNDLNYALMIQLFDTDQTVDNVILQDDEMKLSVNFLNY